jgi:hypothetical protein
MNRFNRAGKGGGLSPPKAKAKPLLKKAPTASGGAGSGGDTSILPERHSSVALDLVEDEELVGKLKIGSKVCLFLFLDRVRLRVLSVSLTSP